MLRPTLEALEPEPDPTSEALEPEPDPTPDSLEPEPEPEPDSSREPEPDTFASLFLFNFLSNGNKSISWVSVR